MYLNLIITCSAFLDMTVPAAPQLQESNLETGLMESIETHLIDYLEDNVDIDADHCKL